MIKQLLVVPLLRVMVVGNKAGYSASISKLASLGSPGVDMKTKPHMASIMYPVLVPP